MMGDWCIIADDCVTDGQTDGRRTSSWMRCIELLVELEKDIPGIDSIVLGLPYFSIWNFRRFSGLFKIIHKVWALRLFPKIAWSDPFLITFRRLCAVLVVPKVWFSRCARLSFWLGFKWWKCVFCGHTNGNYTWSCVLRIDNSTTLKQFFSAIKKFLQKVGKPKSRGVFAFDPGYITFC